MCQKTDSLNNSTANKYTLKKDALPKNNYNHVKQQNRERKKEIQLKSANLTQSVKMQHHIVKLLCLPLQLYYIVYKNAIGLNSICVSDVVDAYSNWPKAAATIEENTRIHKALN